MIQNFSIHTSTPSVVREHSRFCRHCHTPMDRHLEGAFCCHGCRSAFELIETFSLHEFYSIAADSHQKLPAAHAERADYKLFDSAEYQKEFVEAQGSGQRLAHFYLENMSCYACVWVCEQVTRQLDPDAHLSINLSSGEACLNFDPSKVALSEFLQKFEILGFGVNPSSVHADTSKEDLARLGVALFCLSNIMMLALPEYLDPGSLDNNFRNLFRWISCAMAGLSVFYAGQPFLRGAFSSLRNFELHLDLPIGLALIICFFYSLVHTIQGHPHVYFDSTTAVVALLLIGRWTQKKALQKILREKSRFFASEARFARLVHESGHEEIVRLDAIVKGQRLKILAGEVIPLQVELLSAFAEIDPSLLTGESAWLALNHGATIDAGTVNGGTPILVRAIESGAQSFLLRLQATAHALYQDKGSYAALSEKMARVFVLFVLAIATATLLRNWPISTEQAITRFATVLLIACPCIFGFGAPLVISRALILGLRRGVLFKSQNALERLALVRSFYFDKTGTLTEDQSRVVSPQWKSAQLACFSIEKEAVLALFRHLPQLSSHHSLAALAAFAGSGHAMQGIVRDVHEAFGQGVAFTWCDFNVHIGRYAYCFGEDPAHEESLEYAFVSFNRCNIFQFKLQDHLRPEAVMVADELRRQGKSLYILTGDSTERARHVGQALGFDGDHVLSQLQPEEKSSSIASRAETAMVGNGINDSLALAQVEIGVAMANATESLREKAEVSLLDPGLQPLLRAIALSMATRRALQRCFGFALLFNLVGMSLAVGGWVTPVIGAVLMPISSLTIFVIARYWNEEAFWKSSIS